MPRPSQTRSAVKDKVDRSSIHFQKTKMCKFHLLGVCTRGAQCSWAHSQDELKNLPDFYRTKLCHAYLSKGVCRNTECRYAHGYHELRTTDGQEIMDKGNSDNSCTNSMQQQCYSPTQWGSSDMQFAFMQMIPFSPAVNMVDMPVSQGIMDTPSLTKDEECETRPELTTGFFSRQTTMDRHFEILNGDVSTSEDGDHWVGGSDQSSGHATPARSPSHGFSERDEKRNHDVQAHDVVMRVRNTFIEFCSGEDSHLQADDCDKPSSSRRRSCSLDTRIRA